MPGVAFPPVGPVGLSSPPSRVEAALHPAVLCSAPTAPCPSRVAPLSRLAPRYLVRALTLCPVVGSRAAGSYLPAPGLLLSRYPSSSGSANKEADGSPKFPSSPCDSMPRSQTPVESGTHRPLPSRTAAFRSAPRRRLSLWLPQRLSSCPRLYPFRGSITRPGFSLPPAPYSPRGACTRSSLLPCWLGFG